MNYTGCFGQIGLHFYFPFSGLDVLIFEERSTNSHFDLTLVRILVRYTKKMPQVSTDTLLEIGKKMTAIGNKCCNLPEQKRMSCSEHYVSTWIYSFPSFSWRFFLFAKILNPEIANAVIFHKHHAKHLPNKIPSLFIF